ncbi:MAG: hypothetical protein HC767_04665 [Akkermansiaceae bacterium]|nr:hypothetical protein [Akkermansiaceae bacterium]
MLPRSPISFEQFMAQALHDPERGYYARQISAVGRGGDFTTAPMLSTAPARAIAAWARRAMRETGCRHLIEIGPGEGALAAGVLKHLPWLLRRKTQLHLVETSISLLKRQKELLGNRATWHREMKDALAACDGNAVIFSNELVDAFPVRRFQKTPSGWQEIAVHFDQEKRAHESLFLPGDFPDSSGFSREFPIGQRIEVHDSYRKYLTDWLPLWKSGRMLTIDYGATKENLYHRQPLGSVRAYLLQHRLEGAAIYENVGRQDLTADVNFTDLMNWSRSAVSHQSLTNLREFLTNYTSHADRELTDELGAGSAFLVLEEQK